jgi:hypothetical protein
MMAKAYAETSVYYPAAAVQIGSGYVEPSWSVPFLG